MADFPRLKNWESSLNNCIRCGYCYEHCPIWKHTRWETDSPRGKLALLYGMLHGQIEPSEYIAEKIFECFHCGRCQAACSSGVNTMDLFADARADLMDLGFQVSGTTSQTNQDSCVRCLNCVRMCPHEARSFDGKIVVDRLKCQSCGSCLEICSAKGIGILKGYGTNPEELSRDMAAFLDSPDNPEAKAVVFGCGWASYPGFQASRMAEEEARPEHRVFVTACSGRVRTGTVLEALQLGAWGVLLSCCPEDECDHGGSKRARIRMAALQGLLEQIGIDPKRVRVSEVPKTDPKAFSAALNEFMTGIREMGPISQESRT